MAHHRLGRYTLVERIRTGGMAEIWRGLAEGPGGFLRKAAIKVILPGYAEDEDFLQMFMDEAAIAARLTHSNIAQTHDFDVVDGTAYLAMEYVEGKDLRTILETAARKRSPIPWDVAAAIALEVAKGLYYVHTLREASRPLSIVHRDISPQNLMVSYTGEVKIVDFGIARAAKRTAVTRAGEVKGKCAYMSPEQALGRMVDARTDLFSLGVVLWELLTGRRLFGGETPAETVARLVRTVVPPPHELRPDLPRELSPLVLKALARDPSDRYPNMLVFYDTLSRFLFEREHFPGPHRLAAWLRELFPDEVEAHAQGESDKTLPGIDSGPIEITELDTGEWQLLQEEPTEDDLEGTRPMVAGEDAGLSRGSDSNNHGADGEADERVDDDSFVAWDAAQPEARSAAEPFPALRRTAARTVALYLLLAFAGIGIAVGSWAWILGLGPFAKDPLAPPVAVLVDADVAEEIGAEAVFDRPTKEPEPEPEPPPADPSRDQARRAQEATVDPPEPEPIGAEAPPTKEPEPEPESEPEPEPPPADHRREPANVALAEPIGAGKPLPQPEPAASLPKPQQKTKPKRKPKPDPATLGTIHVVARPYAQIRVNGRFSGVAPKDLRLPAGSHRIELEYLGERHTCALTLKAGGEARCEHSFTATEKPPTAP